MYLKIGGIIAVLIFAIIFAGCGEQGNSPFAIDDQPDFIALESTMKQLAQPIAEMPMIQMAPTGISEDRVLTETYYWLGVPYRHGGETKSGVDCSGLVRQVYLAASGGRAYYYDRTADRIRSSSSAVWPPRPGDVLIFLDKGTNYASHVGIYIGPGPSGYYADSYFIHAGKKPGKVVRDRLYYSPYYREGGDGWWFRSFDIYFGRYNADYWQG